MKVPKLVLQMPTPGHTTLFRALGVVAVLACIVGAYVLGQLHAGYNLLTSDVTGSTLAGEKRQLEVLTRRLRQNVSQLETEARVDGEAYTQVDKELENLQARILDQEEELAFYRGIVESNGTPGVRIQSAVVKPGLGTGAFALHLVLAQAFRSDRQVSGRVEIRLEGATDGKIERLDLAAMAPGKVRTLNFSFRYFQDLRTDLLLPDDFVPQRLRVRVVPAGKGSKVVEDFFDWSALTG